MAILNRFAAIFSLFLIFSSQTVALVDQEKQKNLDIGVVLRLKDRFNDTVSGIRLGVEAAKELFEKQHPHVHVRFHYYSHGEKIEEVIASTEKVIQDRISAVIGGELTEESLVLREQFESKKIVWISPTSTNPKVTEGQKYGFRVSVSDQIVASDLARFTVNHLKPAVVGMIHNISSPYTDFQSKRFLEVFSHEMAKRPSDKRIPLFEEQVLSTTLDYENQIKTFKEKKVSHLVIFTHPSDLLRFVLQAKNLEFRPVYIGSDGWGDNQFIFKNLATFPKEKAMFVGYRNSYWNETQTSSITEDFKKVYFARTKLNPTAWSASGFDAAWILMTAMSNVDDPKNSSQIRHAMESLQNLQLVTDVSFSFDLNHGPKVKAGSWAPIYRIDHTGIHFEGSSL